MDLPDGNHASVSAHQQVLTVTAEKHGLNEKKTENGKLQEKKKNRKLCNVERFCLVKVSQQRDACSRVGTRILPGPVDSQRRPHTVKRVDLLVSSAFPADCNIWRGLRGRARAQIRSCLESITAEWKLRPERPGASISE